MAIRTHMGGATAKPLSQACKDALAFLDKHQTFTVEQGDHQELKDALDTLVNRDLVLRIVRKTAGKTYFHYEPNEPLPVFLSNGPRVNWKNVHGCGRFASFQAGEDALRARLSKENRS